MIPRGGALVFERDGPRIFALLLVFVAEGLAMGDLYSLGAMSNFGSEQRFEDLFESCRLNTGSKGFVKPIASSNASSNLTDNSPIIRDR